MTYDPPKYVRRISATEYEYGRIRLADGKNSKYEKHGTKKTLEEALAAAGMAPIKEKA